MTLFMYLLTFISKRVMKVTKILGTMLTFRTTAGGGLSESRGAAIAGVAGHYCIGIFFALCYFLLWRAGIGKPDLPDALLFGLINGIAGIAAWRLSFAIHPRPPVIKLKPYLVTLLIAHLVFALGVVYTFRFLQDIRVVLAGYPGIGVHMDNYQSGFCSISGLVLISPCGMGKYSCLGRVKNSFPTLSLFSISCPISPQRFRS